MKQQYDGRRCGAIKRAIETHIHPKNHRSDFYRDYRNWYIGVTNNTNVRKAQHKRTKKTPALHFGYWDAGTVENACKVEKYFHELGMKDKHGTGGVRPNTTYVYVFKITTNIFDDLAHLFGRIS